MTSAGMRLANKIIDGMITMGTILAKVLSGADPDKARAELEEKGVVITGDPTADAVRDAEAIFPDDTDPGGTNG